MRFFEGLGAAGAIVLSRSIAADRYTGRELGSFMGVMGAIQGIAPITAPMLGALIADAAGWRGIFGFSLARVWCSPSSHCLFSLRRSRARELTVPNVQATVLSAKASVKVLPNSFADPVFCGIVFQQLLASGILFGHISSSPFIFRGHFDLSPELYGLTFGLLALGITAGAVISSRIDPLKRSVSALSACWSVQSLWPFASSQIFRFGPFFPSTSFLMAFLGLTLPAAMTAALTLHRQRAGLQLRSLVQWDLWAAVLSRRSPQSVK